MWHYVTHAHCWVAALLIIVRPDGLVAEVNEELRGILHISTNHESERSHMWTARTLTDYLEFLTIEIRRKRLQVGLEFADTAPSIKKSYSKCVMFIFPGISCLKQVVLSVE